MIRITAMALLLAGVATTAAAQPVKVGRIPADAAVIFASPAAGEKDASGIGIAEELYVSTLDGKDLTRITYSHFTHNHFDVSPDRRYIVAGRASRGDTDHDGKITPRDFKQVWIIDTVKGVEYPIAEGMDGGVGGVAWAADSQSVYFSSANGKGMDIYQVPVAPGGKPKALTAGLNKLLGEPDVPKWVSDVGASPDGKWLAMLYVKDNTQHRKLKDRIVLFKLDGTQARYLTDGGPLEGTPTGQWPNGDFDPEISPGNKYVAFERAMTTDWSVADIFVVNWDGSNVHDVSKPHNDVVNGIPSWTADCRIVYSAWEKAAMYPVVVNPDGSGLKQVPAPPFSHHAQAIPGGPARACK